MSRHRTILVFGSCVDITPAKPSGHGLNLYDGYCIVDVSSRVIFVVCKLHKLQQSAGFINDGIDEPKYRNI